MRCTVAIRGEVVPVEVTRRADVVEATVGDEGWRGTVTVRGDRWTLARGDESVEAQVAADGATVWVEIRGEIYACTVGEDVASEAAAAGVRSPDVTAPMPGKVLQVVVRPGDRVRAGDPLLVLEAMKMETVITAEAEAEVAAVPVEVGAMVEPGQTLVTLSFA